MDALGGRLAALAKNEGLGAVFEQFNFVNRAQTTPVLAITARAGAQGPLREAHRVSRFQNFHGGYGGGGNRRVAV